MKTLIYSFALLTLSMVAFGERQYFVAPDRFEIEIVGGDPAFQVRQGPKGPVARISFVPAYDVSVTAIDHHQRASRDEVEVVRLSFDVKDFVLVNPFLNARNIVPSLDRERDRDRVSVRIGFTDDFTVEQVRLMLASGAVYGTVSGRLICPEGVPQKICDWSVREVPAFNQFRAKDKEGGRARVALAKYAALNRYKAEVRAAEANRIEQGEEIDRIVRTALFDEGKGDVRCLPTLDAYAKWICAMIREQSPNEGNLTEALYRLAQDAFPKREIEESYHLFIFDAHGDQVKTLVAPSPARVKEPRPVPPLQKPPPTVPKVEALMLEWGQGRMDATTFSARLSPYLKWIFPDAKPKEVEKMVETLKGFKSFKETNLTTKILVTVPVYWVEHYHDLESRRYRAFKALVDRRPEHPYFEYLLSYLEDTKSYDEPNHHERHWRDYVNNHYRTEDEAQRKVHVQRFMKIRSMTGHPDFNEEQFRRFFLVLEAGATGKPPIELEK